MASVRLHPRALAAALVALSAAGGVAYLPACSSSASSDAGADGGGTAAAVPGQPPPRPNAGPPSASALERRRVFAIRALHLGEATREGVVDPNAWATYGFDLDARRTTAASTDLCKPKTGPVQEDGPDGLDNVFGSQVLSFLRSIPQVGAEPSKRVNEAIESGVFSLLLEVRGLTDDASQTSTGLLGQLFSAGEFEGRDAGAAPSWGGADLWPVRADSVVGGDVNKAVLTLPDGYVNAGSYVSGTPTDLRVLLRLTGVTLDLPLRRAFLVARHEAPGRLSGGVIAGVLSVQAFLDTVATAIGNLGLTNACPGTLTFRTIAQAVEAVADMRLDGATAGDCDAISVGLGFEAVEAAVPTTIEAPRPPEPNVCADGG